MKTALIVVIVLGMLFGGITYVQNSKPVQYAQEVGHAVQEKVQEHIEPTEEEKRLAEKMKIKEQEAKLEVQLELKQEERKATLAQKDEIIATAKADREAYASSSDAEIKSIQAELSVFMTRAQ